MDDLISRQAAIDAFDKQYWKQINIPISKEIRKAAQDTIRELPSVQRKGKWVRITDEVFADRFECSECGKLPPIENFEWWLSDYCPNCGADMRGESDDRGIHFDSEA